MSDLISKNKLRDFAEQVNGIRPTERSLKGVVDNLINNYKGGSGDLENYEIEFTFTDQNLEIITITGLIPKDESLTTFLFSYVNTQLETLGLPDRVNSMQDVIDLANKYKDNLGAVVICLLCNFMLGKLIATSLVVYSYFMLYGEEDYDSNCWYVITNKIAPVQHRIAEFSGNAYNITTSYFDKATIK